MHAEMHVGLHVDCPVYLYGSNQNWNVLTKFWKILPNLHISMHNYKHSYHKYAVGDYRMLY